jgi:hypothetical protein
MFELWLCDLLEISKLTTPFMWQLSEAQQESVKFWLLQDTATDEQINLWLSL